MSQDWKEMLASMAREGMAEDPEENTPCQPEEKEKVTTSQNLRVILDRKGRKGKVATIIEGFTIDESEVEELASELKRHIGTGGSARGGEILLQGNWVTKTVELLKEKGYNAKA